MYSKSIDWFIYESNTAFNGLKYLLLGKGSSTSAYIYVGGKGKEYIQTNFAAPRSRAINGEIHLFKRCEYYELIVNRNFNHMVKNKRLS